MERVSVWKEGHKACKNGMAATPDQWQPSWGAHACSTGGAQMHVTLERMSRATEISKYYIKKKKLIYLI